MDSGTKGILLDAARRIGRRICKDAIWKDDSCTWNIIVPDASAPNQKSGHEELAGGGVYQGTAGIALFLIELYKVTQDPDLKRTCTGAVKYSLNKMTSFPKNSFGFHFGRIGIIYCAYVFANYFGDQRMLSNVEKLLEEMVGHEGEDHGVDIIGGAAGAIPALLSLYEMSNSDASLQLSVDLSEHLIRTARREPIGWSWDTMKLYSVRNLCGYAHGNSGIGHSFTELYNLTSNDYYLYCAEQAFLYERQFFNEEKNNWPDFRSEELFDFVHYNRLDELREAIRSRSFNPHPTQFMTAWCHGAPGIGLSRLRAFEVTNDTSYKKEARDACEGTMLSLSGELRNYSLCHGISGNCNTLVAGAKILNETKYLGAANSMALAGIKRFEDKGVPWNCGTVGGVSDPSLMLGEAGIGYFLLSLYSNEPVPVLCLTANRKGSNEKSTQFNRVTLQRDYINEYLSGTMELIGSTDQSGADIPSRIGLNIGGKESDVQRASELIQTFIEQQPFSLRTELQSIYTLESHRLEATIKIANFTEEFLRSLVLLSFSDIDWANTIFVLNQNVQLLRMDYDWSSLLSNVGDKKSETKRCETHYVLFALNNKATVVKISSLTHLILRVCADRPNLSEIEDIITKAYDLEGGAESKSKLRETIKSQIYEAYKTGMVSIPV